MMVMMTVVVYDTSNIGTILVVTIMMDVMIMTLVMVAVVVMVVFVLLVVVYLELSAATPGNT